MPRSHESALLARAVAVMGLVGIAVIHLIDVPGKMEEIPFYGWLFLFLIVVSTITAAALLFADNMLAWLVALGASAGPLISYVVSRSVGLPLEHREEVGNWTEPLGLASLAVEGVVVLIAAGALARLTRAERMPSGAPAVATPLA